MKPTNAIYIAIIVMFFIDMALVARLVFTVIKQYLQ